MKAVSRTILARSLAVLATTAGMFLAGSSMAQTAAPAATPAAQPAPGAGPDGGKHEGMRHHMHHGMRGAEFMRHMDTDKDGFISRAEFDAAGQKMMERRNKFFEEADTNHDGKLSREEMQAFRKAHRHDWHREGGMKDHHRDQPAPAPAPKQ